MELVQLLEEVGRDDDEVIHLFQLLLVVQEVEEEAGTENRRLKTLKPQKRVLQKRESLLKKRNRLPKRESRVKEERRVRRWPKSDPLSHF